VNILIAAASFAPSMSGLQRHALNVARCLLPAPEISTVHLVIAPWQRKYVYESGFSTDGRLVTHVAEMNRSSVGRNLWYYCRLPEMAARLKADVVHLSYPMPIKPSAFSCPTLVTLHDLYPYEIPANFGFPKFIFNRIVLQQRLRRVNAIACVSDTTLMRLKQYAPAGVWEKAVRIYNCVGAEPVSAATSPIPGWRGERFLLCVAQHRRNKNIRVLVRAFHRILRAGKVAPDMKLVVIGITGPETRNIRRLVTLLNISESICFLEGVSEPELQWCYSQCDAVVAPSITEGFGLPIAEALLAGCRIVCSDIPAFREIGDRQCRFVALDRNVEKMLGEAIVTTIGEPKPMPKPLHRFSAPVLMMQYLNVYRALIDSATQDLSSQIDQCFGMQEPDTETFCIRRPVLKRSEIEHERI
jgi:glycosyltransferase involved in cell wall biosynthesis